MVDTIFLLRFVAAYTNNNQTILLNTLISEFVVIDNPFDGDDKEGEGSCGEGSCGGDKEGGADDKEGEGGTDNLTEETPKVPEVNE